MTTPNDARSLLSRGTARYELQVREAHLREIEAGFVAYRDSGGFSGDDTEAQLLCLYLLSCVQEEIAAYDEFLAVLARFDRRYHKAASAEERREHILAFARELGASEKQITGDRKAFNRWFGYDAVRERAVNRASRCEYRASFLLDRLGIVAAQALASVANVFEQSRYWGEMRLEEHLTPLLAHPGDVRVRISTFRCLSTAAKSLGTSLRSKSLRGETLAYVYRSAMERGQNVWIQCEALALLEAVSLDDMLKALKPRLSEPADGDDLFVRRRAVQIVCRNAAELSDTEALLDTVCSDPSPYVRRGAAQYGVRCPDDVAVPLYGRLALDDPSPQVRAQAVIMMSGMVASARAVGAVSDIWRQVLERDGHPLVQDAALEYAARVVEATVSKRRERADELVRLLRPCIAMLHSSAADLGIRRRAALVCARIDAAINPKRAQLMGRLKKALDGIPSGKSVHFTGADIRTLTSDELGEVLSVLAQEDFGLIAEKTMRGRRIHKGAVHGFRLWRLAHESVNASPEKRQAHSHVAARAFPGDVAAPSSIMSEVTRTNLPGEPLKMSSEAGWRPYLPLPGFVLESLSRSLGRKEAAVYTPEGVTRLLPPKHLMRRVASSMRLGRNFAEYANLRNWREGDTTSPAAYAEALHKLGFTVSYSPRREGEADPAVQRFFPVAVPFLDTELWYDMQEYFFSAYENSLYELGVFASGMLLLFLGRRVVMHRAAADARSRIPLVVGGWGTRGKSGTERLKAGLFEALGHPLVSKTTGSEALFLHSHAFGRTKEMFLFRPYDKATIWEHHEMLMRAPRLGAAVFLWECMGLTPSYVRILQHRWSRDDISTITNTYPDHEDIQGPSGRDVARVIAEFVPDNGVLLTTEKEMTPILRETAKARSTRFSPIDRFASGLLTPDVLERFPYSEHPDNIALALASAREMGVSEDYALKEIADRVIPDIGVLKAFPVSEVRGRRLEFVNGMAANERFGTLGNWNRMGFGDQDPESDPGVFICTLINNRADRVSRSRMFASMAVADLAADRHFLIGTNLNGLLGYIREELELRLEGMTLGIPGRNPAEILAESAKAWRLPRSMDTVAARLRIMLGCITDTEELPEKMPDLEDVLARFEATEDEGLGRDIRAFIREESAMVAQYETLRSGLEKNPGGGDESLDEEFRNYLRAGFERKIVVVEDVHASGEEVLAHIVRGIPPGLMGRVMGLQNIKGTGLDFVYRWQAWELCRAACRLLSSEDRIEMEKGLGLLVAFEEYGSLSENLVRKTVEMCKSRPYAQSERVQASLVFIENKLDQSLEDLGRSGGRNKGLVAGIYNVIESFLDAGDAVSRRKKADRIYRDLESERISHERAALELKRLNMRQKGGWFGGK